MTFDLNDLLKGGEEPDEAQVRVLVDLAVTAPDADTLQRLRDAGLHIDKVIQNKVIGSIERAHIPRLKQDPVVRVVEPSTQVKPHAKR